MARRSPTLRAIVALSAALATPLASTARAQDVMTASPPAASITAPAAPAASGGLAAPAPATDEAWRKYDAAFEALLEGHRDQALRMLGDVAAAGPAHPAARRAAELLALRAAEPQAPELENRRFEGPTRGARAELASFQTFHGIAVGIELCVLLPCNDPGMAIAMLGLLGGAGLGASLVATSDGIRPGTTAALDSGVQWGAWNAIALGVAGDFGSHAFVGTLLLGQGLGLGAGGALAATVRPTAGQVSLASTVGLWSGVVTALGFGAAQAGTRQSIMVSLLATSDLGLAGGALLAARYPVSRGHALLIDAGGAGGALAALGLTALIGGDGTKGQTYFFAMIPGTLVGLGASTYLTRHWDAPSLPVDVAVAPLPDGRGATVGVGGRF